MLRVRIPNNLLKTVKDVSGSMVEIPNFGYMFVFKQFFSEDCLLDISNALRVDLFDPLKVYIGYCDSSRSMNLSTIIIWDK